MVSAGALLVMQLLRLTHAPGNGAAIGESLKVTTENGWFARPSGTEHLQDLLWKF